MSSTLPVFLAAGGEHPTLIHLFCEYDFNIPFQQCAVARGIAHAWWLAARHLFSSSHSGMHETSFAGRGIVLGDVDVMSRLALDLEVAHSSLLDPEDRMID